MTKNTFFIFLGILNSWLVEISQPYGSYLFLVVLALFFYFYQLSKKPFFHAWLYQSSYFINSLWWIYISLHDIGHVNKALSIFSVIALSIYLSLFFSVFLSLTKKNIFSNHLQHIGMASSVCLSEWLRGFVLTGFPWAGIAESQIDGPFSIFIPLLGGLFCVWISIFYISCFVHMKTKWKEKFFLTLLLILFYFIFSSLKWTSNCDQPILVELIQGNFSNPFSDKKQKNIQKEFYLNKISNSSAKLIVIPESALPFTEKELKFDILSIQKKIKKTEQYIVAGILEEDFSLFKNQLYNSAIGISSSEIYRYDKHHLLPFGEYIPIGFKWFVNSFGVDLEQFSHGPLIQKSFNIHPYNHKQLISLGTMICYEDAFGSALAKRQKYQEHNLWINITNLAWFGNSQASKQQLRLARLRSLETGIPTVRATNTGITAIINEHGHVMHSISGFKKGSLIATVQPFTGKTPYVNVGNFPIIGFSFLSLFFCIWCSKRYTNKHNN